MSPSFASPTLAVSLPLPGSTRQGLEIARRANSWGYTACWASEVQGPDAVSQLGALAFTTDMHLGVAVLPVQTRAPFLLAMSALTLSEVSGERFSLGIGASSEVIVRRWAGRPFDAPLQEVREALQALRPLLRGEKIRYRGQRIQIDGYRPYYAPRHPVAMYLGALGPRMLRLGGELADGVCLNQIPAQHLPELFVPLHEGAKAAGRDVGDLGVMARLFCAVTDDRAAARKVVRRSFAPYLATTAYNRHYHRMGYTEEADAARAAAERGDRESVVAAMSDQLIDEVFVLGDADSVAARVHDYIANGVTIAAIQPMTDTLEDAERTLRAIGEAWPW